MSYTKTRLLHLSDLHFGWPYLPEVGNSISALAAELGPDAIVISGDFTQRCEEPEFEAAREFLRRLPDVPLVVVPGNHDVPLYYRVIRRIVQPYAFYQKYVCQDLDVVVRLPDTTLVGLNSTKPLRAIKNGRISKVQLEFAARAFAQAPDDDWKIVIAHHHFAPAPDYEGSDVMPKAKRALDEFARQQVDVILGGHLHRAYIGNSLDVYAGSAALERGIIIVQSGTATSRRGRAREREKNSFNVLDLESAQVKISHWMYFDRLKRFCEVSEHRFPKPSRRAFDCDV